MALIKTKPTSAGRRFVVKTATFRSGRKPLQYGTTINHDLLDHQGVDIGAFVILGIRDCRFQTLTDGQGGLFSSEAQNL